jgi:hypothetical protein
MHMLGGKGWAGLASIVVAVGLGGCASTSAGNARCAVRSNNPHNSKGTPTDIVGKAQFGCDTAIDSVTAVVKIQQKVSGTWADVSGLADRTQPAPKANTQYVVQAAMACRPGTFRTASQGYGYYHGVRSQSTAWDYSAAVTNPCG